MCRTPAIPRFSVHKELAPQPVATPEAPSRQPEAPSRPPEAPSEPPVAQCAAFIRVCRDSLVPLLDRSALATPKEFRILKQLRAERGDCAATVARALAIDDGEMSRLTARLVARNLVDKVPAAGRRKSALRLTSLGRALVDRGHWAEHCLLEARLEGLDGPELEALRQAIETVTDLLCGTSAQ